MDVFWKYYEKFGTRAFESVVGGTYIEFEDDKEAYEVPDEITAEEIEKIMNEGLEGGKDVLKERFQKEEYRSENEGNVLI